VRIWPYAGKPGVSRTTGDVRSDVYSDNVTGAENQQERLIEFRGWVIGFVDGEGCFSIGLVRQPDRAGRRGYTTGYQVSHDFVVTQSASSARCLEELREFFGVGQVYVNRRRDNHRENLYRYSVHRRQDLIDRIIPFFREHPLRSAKQHDFEKFASCVELMAGGHHKTHAGLAEIVEIMQTMNRRKPRHELIRILRDHTPETLDTGS
jgi:LAGLIDADG DNA endonuclease family protein